MSQLKILHCPTTVGGNPCGLSRTEKDMGYDSQCLTLTQNYLNYDVDHVLLKHEERKLSDEPKIWWAAIQSLFQNDVIHYNFGQSLSPFRARPQSRNFPRWQVFLYTDVYARFFQLWDVKIAKLLGKTIAVTYQGSDARQADYCRKHYPIHFYHEPDMSDDGSDDYKRKRIEIFDKYADFIYSVNPDLMHVLPKRTRFTPYASVDPEEWEIHPVDENPAVPHIVHAPSNRTIKGTQYIIDAFERLGKEGVAFRYTLVENMPNAEAKEVYKTADLLIDQLLAGYYGGLAVELMMLGKPVICYMREEDMKYLPAEMYENMPIINAQPDNIYDVLKEWITKRKTELHTKGLESRSYAEKWHNPKTIARSILDDFEGLQRNKK